MSELSSDNNIIIFSFNRKMIDNEISSFTIELSSINNNKTIDFKVKSITYQDDMIQAEIKVN